MEFLGIGPVELLFILIIILLVLGPNEMVKAIRTIGRVLREIVTSDWWASAKQAIQDVRKLPYDLMREAGMEEDLKALDEIRQATSSSLKTPAKKGAPPKKQAPDLSAWTKPNLSEAPGDQTLSENDEKTTQGSQPFELRPAEDEQTILPPDTQADIGTQDDDSEQDQPQNEGGQQD